MGSRLRPDTTYIRGHTRRFDTTSLPKTTGINVADLRKELVNKMRALIAKQTGAAASDPALKGMFEDVAPQCKDQYGFAGQVPESLSSLSDATWLGNMIRFVDGQISFAMSNQVAPEADDIPF